MAACMNKKQLKLSPLYSITPKDSLHPDQCTDRKLIELDITGRFDHRSCLLIFANNETSFEELYIMTGKEAGNHFLSLIISLYCQLISFVI